MRTGGRCVRAPTIPACAPLQGEGPTAAPGRGGGSESSGSGSAGESRAGGAAGDHDDESSCLPLPLAPDANWGARLLKCPLQPPPPSPPAHQLECAALTHVQAHARTAGGGEETEGAGGSSSVHQGRSSAGRHGQHPSARHTGTRWLPPAGMRCRRPRPAAVQHTCIGAAARTRCLCMPATTRLLDAARASSRAPSNSPPLEHWAAAACPHPLPPSLGACAGNADERSKRLAMSGEEAFAARARLSGGGAAGGAAGERAASGTAQRGKRPAARHGRGMCGAGNADRCNGTPCHAAVHMRAMAGGLVRSNARLVRRPPPPRCCRPPAGAGPGPGSSAEPPAGPESTKGMTLAEKLLKKMGWREGEGLGKARQVRSRSRRGCMARWMLLLAAAAWDPLRQSSPHAHTLAAPSGNHCRA